MKSPPWLKVSPKFLKKNYKTLAPNKTSWFLDIPCDKELLLLRLSIMNQESSWKASWMISDNQLDPDLQACYQTLDEWERSESGRCGLSGRSPGLQTCVWGSSMVIITWTSWSSSPMMIEDFFYHHILVMIMGWWKISIWSWTKKRSYQW